MAGTPIPLSSSIGGNLVLLDDATLPGKKIHVNLVDSGANHIVTDILVVNPNPIPITLWACTQGEGIPVPTKKDVSEMIRIDVPATSEGNEPRLFYTPFILAPGYSYHIARESLREPVHVYLIGYVETYEIAAGGVGGYGGIVTLAEQTMPNIAASTWGTVPFETGALAIPWNVEQDPANNRFRVQTTGVWNIQVYGVANVKKKNSDRYAYWRFYDETANQPLSPNPFPVPLENGENFMSFQGVGVLVDVDAAVVNHWIRLELGDAKEIGAADVPLEDIKIAKAGVSLFKVQNPPATFIT